MLNFTSTTVSTDISTNSFLLCTAASLILGLVIAAVFRFRSKSSKGFLITLAVMPAIVQVVIMLVNGNIGTGIAVMGAFSLVRFRSVPGNAKDICGIFLSMAVGLATGTGYIKTAVIFTAIVCAAVIVYTLIPLGEASGEKQLVITIPESLDYSEVFDEIMQKYTDSSELVNVKTTNMGSLFKLTYHIRFKKNAAEKKFIDELRCRNGNLEISCGRVVNNSGFEQL